MKPKTLSASSLLNWEACQAKFKAVNVDYIPEVGRKEPAKVGTSVHYALEHFVRDVYMLQTHSWDDLEHLLALYHAGYKETFGSANKATREYRDGLALTKDWHARTNLEGWTIDNVEEKKRFPIGDSDILCTYIFDRVQRKIDEDGRRILKVVDYKSERKTYTFEELEDKLQVRIYGLAAAIEYKEWQPDEIWVELDMLRFTPVGIEITREMNIATWEYLLETAQMVLDANPEDLMRTLTADGCKYCPVQLTCEPLLLNRDAQGLMSITDMDEVARLHEQLSGQQGGLKGIIEHLEVLITQHAEETEQTKYEVGGKAVTVSLGGRRDISDTARAATILGPELMKMFGKLGISDVDKILDSEQIDEQQKADLRRLIVKKPNSKPTIKVKPVSPVKRRTAAAK